MKAKLVVCQERGTEHLVRQKRCVEAKNVTPGISGAADATGARPVEQGIAGQGRRAADLAQPAGENDVQVVPLGVAHEVAERGRVQAVGHSGEEQIGARGVGKPRIQGAREIGTGVEDGEALVGCAVPIEELGEGVGGSCCQRFGDVLAFLGATFCR